MVGCGATVWDLLPTYPLRNTEHGASGSPLRGFLDYGSSDLDPKIMGY